MLLCKTKGFTVLATPFYTTRDYELKETENTALAVALIMDRDSNEVTTLGEKLRPKFLVRLLNLNKMMYTGIKGSVIDN